MSLLDRAPLPFVGSLVFVALLSGFVGAVLFSLTIAGGAERAAPALISVFGFSNGMFALFLAIYLTYGPRLNLPYTPKTDLPARAPLTLFGLGAGMVLVSLRFLTGTTPMTMFWRVVGFTILSMVSVGVTVSYVTRYSPADEPPVELPDGDE